LDNRGCTALTTSGRLSQRPLHSEQIGDVGADYFQVIADGLLEFATGVATFDQVQQLADFVER
jgi:hypothetical protein